jgi:hypothetical protein
MSQDVTENSTGMQSPDIPCGCETLAFIAATACCSTGSLDASTSKRFCPAMVQLTHNLLSSCVYPHVSVLMRLFLHRSTGSLDPATSRPFCAAMVQLGLNSWLLYLTVIVASANMQYQETCAKHQESPDAQSGCQLPDPLQHTVVAC